MVGMIECHHKFLIVYIPQREAIFDFFDVENEIPAYLPLTLNQSTR